MDYTRCIKLESAWVGTADDEVIKTVRVSQLGESARRRKDDVSKAVQDLADMHFSTLRQVDLARYETVLAFFQDMLGNLSSVYQSLRPGGDYFVIVGTVSYTHLTLPTKA